MRRLSVQIVFLIAKILKLTLGGKSLAYKIFDVRNVHAATGILFKSVCIMLL